MYKKITRLISWQINKYSNCFKISTSLLILKHVKRKLNDKMQQKGKKSRKSEIPIMSMHYRLVLMVMF